CALAAITLLPCATTLTVSPAIYLASAPAPMDSKAVATTSILSASNVTVFANTLVALVPSLTSPINERKLLLSVLNADAKLLPAASLSAFISSLLDASATTSASALILPLTPSCWIVSVVSPVAAASASSACGMALASCVYPFTDNRPR